MPSDVTSAQTEPDASPVIEPPSVKLIVRLFLIPLIIVSVAVGIMFLIAMMAGQTPSFEEALSRLKNPGGQRTADWLIGPDIMGPGTTAKSLRTFKAGLAYENDPNLGTDPQPKHLKNKYTGTSDSGGVHINSGIPNHAFFLVATALGGNAWLKAGRIWYGTLLALNQTSDFAQMVAMTTQTAATQFGHGSAEEKAVIKAWQAVGF